MISCQLGTFVKFSYRALNFTTGRVDCPTSPTTDEVLLYPSALWNTEQVVDYFNETFGLFPDETVAVMG